MGNVKKPTDVDSSEIKEYYSVEALREKSETPLAIFEGTKVWKGWKAGKQLKEAEYLEAVEQFMTATAGRR